VKYLLDTCVISELAKKAPTPSVIHWMEKIEDEDLYVSAVTIGEIRKGIERLSTDDGRRLRLESWYNSVVREFEGHIVSFAREEAVEWGRIVGTAMRQGIVRSLIDMQILSTAFRHGMTLVTRNVKDMKDMGVTVVNPFE